jgi:predicted RNA-binding protein YlxR (DUF448 family)
MIFVPRLHHNEREEKPQMIRLYRFDDSPIEEEAKEKETRRSLCVSPPIEAFIEADSHRG